jgi:DNA-binding NtrC family response regulator
MSTHGSILIADDEETFREAIGQLLRNAGYDCVIVASGPAAHAELARRSFDVLIADIRMPGNGQLELVRELPQVAPDLPVILVTGYPTAATAIESIELPVVAYMVKPLDLAALLDHVAAGVSSARTRRALRQSRERLAAWAQELATLEQSARATPREPTGETYLNIMLQHLLLGVRDLQEHVAQLTSRSPVDFTLTRELLELLQQTLTALETVQKDLDPAALAALRQRLEQWADRPRT